MAIYKRDIVDINLETGNIHRSFLNHTIGYKDQKADHFGVRVFRDGVAVNLTGVSVQGVFMPPQGSPIAITSGNIVSGNVAEVVLPQACYNYNGQFCLSIKLVDSSNSVTGTVRIVDGVVDNTHASGTVAPTSAVPTYQEVLSTYEQAIAAINKTVRFDTAQSLTDVQKAQARVNIDAVSAATANELAMEIGAVVESADNASYIDLGNKWVHYRRGYYSTPAVGSTSSYQSSNDYVYAIAACQPGDKVTAHAYGGATGTAAAWAFLDSSLNVLSKAGSNVNFEGSLTAPASTTFVLFNNKLSSLGSGYYAIIGDKMTQDQISDLKSAIDDKLTPDDRKLFQTVFCVLGSGNKTQTSGTYAYNAIPIGKKMTVGHKYRIYLRFNNYTTSDFNKLSNLYIATSNSSGGRVADLKPVMVEQIGYSYFNGGWVWFEYTATAQTNYLCPAYGSGYPYGSDESLDWSVVDLDAVAFTPSSYIEDINNNAEEIEDIKETLYETVSEGEKAQGSSTYGTNAISLGTTLVAGETYALSLYFVGTYAGFLTYLNNIYMATSDASGGRVEDIKSLFTAIESPLAVGKWYTVNYTPSANVSYLCPAYSSNYSPSSDNKIKYKVVKTESNIDELFDKVNNSKIYNFTPINTWEESAVPSAITTTLNNMSNDILLTCQGDSLTALIEYSGAQTDPAHCPPGMQYKSWTYWLWENMARVKPMCDRLDSQRNDADFFTKSGTWEQVGGTKFDAEGYTWDFARERSVACLTYQSNSSGASVEFAFDADTYDKCNIVFSLKPDGAKCEIVVTEGNGKMLASLDRTTWVEANGFSHDQNSNPDSLGYSAVQDAGLALQQRHRRIWLKKASNEVTGTVNITYKRSTTQTLSDPYIYCWGVERWKGNTVFVDNIGRGGRYTRLLSYNISDIFDRNPDFAMYEMPLANETDEGYANIQGFYEQYFTSAGNNSYKTRSENYTKVPLIVFLPHGRGTFFDDNNAAKFDTAHQVTGDPVAYVIYMTIFNWLKGQLASYSNVSVINLYCRLLNEATGISERINKVFGSNGENALTQDTVHLNARGARMYCKYLLPLYQR